MAEKRRSIATPVCRTAVTPRDTAGAVYMAVESRGLVRTNGFPCRKRARDVMDRVYLSRNARRKRKTEIISNPISRPLSSSLRSVFRLLFPDVGVLVLTDRQRFAVLPVLELGTEVLILFLTYPV